MGILTRILHMGLTDREVLASRLRSSFRPPTSRARIIVAVLHNWADFELSLRHLTPNGDGVWGQVSFVPYGATRNPDFVLVFNSISTRWKVLRISPERLWFACSEAPNKVHTAWHEGQGDRATVITAARETFLSATARSYIQSPPITPTWWVHKSYQELKVTSDIPKTRVLSWITSNFTNLEGHRARMRFLERLKENIEFDLFGRGFSPLADKWDGLAPYRYSIAFENTIAPHYFTEKLMDCFVSNTLPIYFGAPNIADYFPEKALIRIDPDDPKVFTIIRDIISSDLWRERLPYVLEAKELVLNKYNMYARLAAWIGAAAKEPPSKRKWSVIGSRKLQFT